jgi:heme/copper-type cytochrome/quinol oxidase subunit 2
MKGSNIKPHYVTRPIQLLAAWLVGLVLINSSFLTAASIIKIPEWVPGVLVLSAVINVPLFLILIFFLQTKYRRELQEDTYYAQHMEKVDFYELSMPSKMIIFLVGMASERKLTYYTPRDEEYILNDALRQLVQDLYNEHKFKLCSELKKWIYSNDKNLLWLASEIIGFYEIKELSEDLFEKYKNININDKWPQWQLNFIWAHSKIDNDYDELINFLFETQDKKNKRWVVGAFFQMIEKGYSKPQKLEAAISKLEKIENIKISKPDVLQMNLIKQQP